MRDTTLPGLITALPEPCLRHTGFDPGGRPAGPGNLPGLHPVDLCPGREVALGTALAAGLGRWPRTSDAIPLPHMIESMSECTVCKSFTISICQICLSLYLVPRGYRGGGRPMTAPASPTVRRRRLAAELRGIRESKGKSGEAVAAALQWSPSKISRYERARTGLRPREVERLLDYYGITGSHRVLLLGLAEDAAQKGWWEEFADSLSEDYQQFIGLEYEATSINIWHVDVVTGLLQTEAYARHIISSYSRVEPIPPGMIGRMVKVRTRRQQVLTATIFSCQSCSMNRS